MKILQHWTLILAVVVCEPVAHFLSLPHPEGLTQIALNYLATSPR